MSERGPVAVISGGMGGVGRSAASALSGAGYRLALFYHNSSPEEISEVKKSLPEDTLFLQSDLSDASDTRELIRKLVTEVRAIDLAIHAAVDPIAREALTTMTPNTFRGQFETGLFGGFNFLQPLAQLFKEQGHGSIVGITSEVIESPTTPARMSAYAVEKIALRGLLRELHRELSPKGVRVLAVSPGLMQTKLNNDLPEKFFEVVAGTSGSATMTPSEVARAIVHITENKAIASGVSYSVATKEITPL